MDVNDFFAKNYDEARQKFLDAAKVVGAAIESIKILDLGPNGQELFTDIAWVGKKEATKVLLLISGTHGAEGLCGSGAQIGALLDTAKSLPDDVALFLIHANNPYGFAWQRRATEEGIDLCRNFLDFNKVLPENPLYDELVSYLVPREWTGPVREQADQRIKKCIDEIGMSEYIAQIPLGQYKYDFAPFFGGQKPARANIALRNIVKKYLSAATDVAIIDYHTGLGPYGHGELLCFHQPESAELARARQWWRGRLTSVFGDESVAYPLTGGVLDGLEMMLPNANVTAAAYEFGTVDPMSVVDAMRADHWLHTYGDFDSPLAKEIKQNMFDVFFGDTDDWRENVWEQSKWATEQAIRNLSQE